jgi:hypothetical protein
MELVEGWMFCRWSCNSKSHISCRYNHGICSNPFACWHLCPYSGCFFGG